LSSDAPAPRDEDGDAPPLVERLRAVHSAMIDAVLRREGVRRIAELAAQAAGAPVAIVVPRLGIAVRVPDGDTGAIAGYVEARARERPAPVPAEVVADVPVTAGDERMGEVLLLRGDAAPDAFEYLHLAAKACLTEVAVAEAREEVEQNLRGTLLEELRSGRALETADVVRRAARMGCDLQRGAVALCAALTVDRPRLVVASITSDHPGALAQALDGRVYGLLPARAGNGAGAAEATVAAARRLAARLERHGPVGVSSFYAEPRDLSRAMEEAELVLDVVSRSEGGPITEDIGSGAYRLLFRVLASHPEEVRSFYEDTVAPIVSYDDQYGTDLVGTLEAYLERNGAMGATAQAIYAHRHTVAYRLERVRELTGLDPSVSDDRERLGLGLKAHRLLAPRLPR
jgi:PucR family transcriptional regulator, purine catabolism regulatory protein